ncbi:hypothetical protein RB601_005567 [Gaeumannomyces tritici]
MPPPLITPSTSPLRSLSEQGSERGLGDHANDWEWGGFDQESEQDLKLGKVEQDALGLQNLEYEDQSQAEWHVPLRSPLPKGKTISVDIPESTLATPRSLYKRYNAVTDAWELPPSVPEDKALAALQQGDHSARRAQVKVGNKDENDDDDDDDEDEYYLDDFAIYADNAQHSGDLISLHELFRMGKSTLFFDGTLSKGQNRHEKWQLEHVAFDELSIGNYGLENHTIGDKVWIRSTLNREKGGVWYKLGAPGIEYIRFFEPFRWLADLAKHLVDFIESRNNEAGIHDFREDFARWLVLRHGNDASFQQWFQQHPSYDYRSKVSEYAEFLWDQVYGTVTDSRQIKLFNEVLHFTQYPEHSPLANYTVVTPYIHSLFDHLDCQSFLKATSPKNARATTIPRVTHKQARNDGPLTEALLASIKPGDVISTPPDDSTSGTKWAHNHNHARWYARVQGLSRTKNGERMFHIAWLYHPKDTPCGSQRYPWDNELFYSSHCSCHSSTTEDRPIPAGEVLGIHSVEWFGNENTKAEFFIRQMYLTDERRWVVLRESDFTCSQDRGRRYEVGDTVLARTFPNGKTLEPYEIVDLSGGNANFRKLERRDRIDGSDTAPNELIYTDDTISMPISWIQGPCTVRIIPSDAAPSTPYDRRGTGNIFYITHRRQDDSTLTPFDDASIPSTFRQGFNPLEMGKSFTPLRGLDLFAGCGNLGRGIEEGGAVRVKWVNDIWNVAIHTYMANADPDAVPFLGSVDTMLEKALKGECGPSVPAKGEVEFISGGSPCQGFSLLTANKSSEAQKKNRSLVASFASFVDFYRPKYGILENVSSMVGKSDNPGSDYFSQLLCAIVGMGYQIQIILGDAWTYGAPQSRSRVFLIFALPGCTLPERPMMSHSHPGGTKRFSLGKLSNNEQFSQREFEPTAFSYVSSGEAMKGLPNIQDGRVRICPGFSDHNSSATSPIEQLRTSLIPTAPYGMGFAKAYYKTGQITEAERLCFPENPSHRVQPKSRGWTRQDPTKLFATVTTTPQPTDARTAHITHPFEHRTLSILEIRRAQGVPDDEVLVGSFANRWKLIGNSVARQASLALGLELRRAMCGGSLYETRDVPGGVGVEVEVPEETVMPEVEEIKVTTTTTTEIEVSYRPAAASAQPQPQCPTSAHGDGDERPAAARVQVSASKAVFTSTSTLTSRLASVMATGVKRRASCGNEVSMVKRHRKGSLEDTIVCR